MPDLDWPTLRHALTICAVLDVLIIGALAILAAAVTLTPIFTKALP